MDFENIWPFGGKRRGSAASRETGCCFTTGSQRYQDDEAEAEGTPKPLIAANASDSDEQATEKKTTTAVTGPAKKAAAADAETVDSESDESDEEASEEEAPDPDEKAAAEKATAADAPIEVVAAKIAEAEKKAAAIKTEETKILEKTAQAPTDPAAENAANDLASEIQSGGFQNTLTKLQADAAILKKEVANAAKRFDSMFNKSLSNAAVLRMAKKLQLSQSEGRRVQTQSPTFSEEVKKRDEIETNLLPSTKQGSNGQPPAAIKG